jgi:sulfur relay (sulfurtransferase) DsrC/TusE family protein
MLARRVEDRSYEIDAKGVCKVAGLPKPTGCV